MTAPIWVPLPVTIIIHDRQIARHGGAAGMRDRGLLEAACARPVNKFEYGETDLPTLTGAYAYGIAKAHAFVDGNKRTAFVTAFTFLRLNGYTFRPDPIDGVRMMEDLARDVVSEEEFAEWVRPS
ncbi:addiction module death-on-curing protein [Octadecabacter antarcticus 307]|uniref:Addiction module death-on-curing protein n=1 Tax=Octadecabacter antarcticus 307 TaxID=391626 RepID=M9RAV1_9RHOB|nr:type II toxin-antitoxin system death-on-curing family toxin [Octadecabacter antarcticus]AGI69779.1 addiction module death-on-curing protein [Octadecabacter antarcticus 307]